MKSLACFGGILVLAVVLVPGAPGQNWDQVPLISHQTFQAVNPDGSSAYSGGFPVRLRGVLLNNHEDWLDPRPAYDPEYHPWQMGGQWEVFVQTADPNDFGGTACWMGQNYGNVPWHADPTFSYTDSEWLAELARVNHDPNTGILLRRGDLIEIRGRGGLPYAGKMNVNEQHSNDPALDFELILLQQGYGLPTPAPVILSDLKDPNNAFIWDWTRQTGGERYQATLIEVQDVHLVSSAGWGANAQMTVTDSTGRTLPMRLGRNPAFQQVPAPNGEFDVVGILNQVSSSGIGGYYLLVLSPVDFTPPLPFYGDANCDGEITFADIDYFLVALAGQATWEQLYPDCPWLSADMNRDGEVTFADIDGFVAALGGQGL